MKMINSKYQQCVLICTGGSLHPINNQSDCGVFVLNLYFEYFVPLKSSSMETELLRHEDVSDNSHLSCIIEPLYYEYHYFVILFGIKVDYKLTLDQHILKIIDKLNKVFYVILNIKRVTNLSTIMMVYYMLVYIDTCMVLFIGNIKLKVIRFLFNKRR